jgi:putative ABC transport system permease protein
MLKNYFVVALRNITKHKTFSFINIFGLALAMSVCLLVILMLADQRRYERFNTKSDRIYRILTHAPGGPQAYATSPFPTAASLKANYPAIEDAVTLRPSVTGDAKAGENITVMKGYITDPSFFNIFDYNLTYGDKKSALLQPRSIVISAAIAQRLFPGSDPVGKTVEFFNRGLAFPIESDDNGHAPVLWGSFTVTGVFDPSQYKSHLKFDVLMSAATVPALVAEKKLDDLSTNWNWYFRTYTFALLREDKGRRDLELALNDLVKRNEASIQEEYSKGLTLAPQGLEDVQLGLTGNDTSNRLPIQGFYFLGILALIIMLSACLNYTNLSIARALTRAKEIGIRKVTGANKRSLVFQFLGESVIVSMLALTMAVVFLQALRPAFKNLWLNKHLNFELPNEPLAYAAFVGFALIVGIVAGTFPAFRMSSYQPIMALKKQDGSRASRFGLRKALSVSQFCLSLLFITTSILIFKQFQHYMTFDYGMKTENVINIGLRGVDYQEASNRLSQIPGVVGVSASDLIPATGESNGDAIRKPGQSDAEFQSAWIIVADENFIDNLGLSLIAGKKIPPSKDSTTVQVIVSEELAKTFGYNQPSQIVGETFETKWSKQSVVVAGVVKDFHYQLLINKDTPGPLMIYNRPSGFKYLNVKVSTSNMPALISALEDAWKTLDPLHSMSYEFFDDQLEGTHRAIFDVVSILGFISFLAIVIACLGLLGMATYMAERRKKEVGIRKVLGAADWGITMLLSKAFLKVLAIAVLIGGPLSYFISNLWLEFIPNRVDFGFGTVAIAAMLLLILGLITVGSQTIKASRSNPVDTLKEE